MGTTATGTFSQSGGTNTTKYLGVGPPVPLELGRAMGDREHRPLPEKPVRRAVAPALDRAQVEELPEDRPERAAGRLLRRDAGVGRVLVRDPVGGLPAHPPDRAGRSARCRAGVSRMT